MRKTDEPIIVEQTFDTSIDKVWNAVTKLDEMKQWFFKEIDHLSLKLDLRRNLLYTLRIENIYICGN